VLDGDFAVGAAEISPPPHFRRRFDFRRQCAQAVLDD